MVKTLILPGLNGSGQTHWQRIWARDFPGSEVVEQENWTCPNLHEWKRTLEQRLSLITEGVHLVAHSLGCILAAHAARSPEASKIRSAFLVAPCNLRVVEDLHPCAVQMDELPESRLPFPSLVIGSTNDHYMKLDDLMKQANTWGSEVKVLGNAGHINVASGFGRWPSGYQMFSDFNRNLNSPSNERISPQHSPRVDLLESVVTSGLSAFPH